MAQQTTVTLTDDLDGGKAAETVSFGLDGRIYEIDLSKKNATALRKALGEFTAFRSSRPFRSTGGRRRAAVVGPGRCQGGPGMGAGQGIAVSARGRVPAEIVEQYQAAAD